MKKHGAIRSSGAPVLSGVTSPTTDQAITSSGHDTQSGTCLRLVLAHRPEQQCRDADQNQQRRDEQNCTFAIACTLLWTARCSCDSVLGTLDAHARRPQQFDVACANFLPVSLSTLESRLSTVSSSRRARTVTSMPRTHHCHDHLLRRWNEERTCCRHMMRR